MSVDVGALPFIVLFIAAAGWWLHGWRTLRADQLRADRDAMRRAAQRALAADSEHRT